MASTASGRDLLQAVFQYEKQISELSEHLRTGRPPVHRPESTTSMSSAPPPPRTNALNTSALGARPPNAVRQSLPGPAFQPPLPREPRPPADTSFTAGGLPPLPKGPPPPPGQPPLPPS